MKLLNKIRLSVLMVAVSVFCSVAFVGCTDEQAQMEIAKLKTENELLQMQADSLQRALKVKQAQEDSVKKSLQSLDMGF